MDRVLVVYLKKREYKIINSLETYNTMIDENDLVFKAPLLSGYGFMGINRLTVMGKHTTSTVGGYFAHYQKCNGYDYIIFKEKSKSFVNIYIDKDTIILEDAKLIKDNLDIKNYINKEFNNKKLEYAYLGIAGLNKLNFSKIIFNNNKSCGKNGLGQLMGDKNIYFIGLAKNENLNPHNKKLLDELNSKLMKNINNEDIETWYSQNNSCYGCNLNCESTSIKKIMKNGLTYIESSLINDISNLYGMDSINFSKIYTYYKDNIDKNIKIEKLANMIINKEFIDYENAIMKNIHKDKKSKDKKYAEEDLGFCKFLINKGIMEGIDINELVSSAINYN